MSNIQWVAAIASRADLDTQTLLVQVVSAWRGAGCHIAGVVGANQSTEAPCAAGHLCDLASGTQIAISEEAGAGKRRAAPGGFTRMAQLLVPQLAQADIVVLSEFGELEKKQRGLWPAFLAATIACKPVLTTSSVEQKQVFERYAPQVQWVLPVLGDILRWSETALRP